MTMTASAEISLSALRHNLFIVRQTAPHARCMAVIKANAYGHGVQAVAAALDQADAFAVARLSEALALRQAGITKRILILGGVQTTADLDEVCAQSLDIVLHHESQLQLLLNTAVNEPICVWVKIDTGMHRLGFAPDRLTNIIDSLRSCHWVQQDLHVMTHFACADDSQDSRTHEQMALFQKITRGLEITTSLANSAAILSLPESHADWVRPGIMLYGSSPFITGKAEDYQLKPVMRLKSNLIAINEYRTGDSIGYGATFTCPREMRVGVVAIGYGDGYPRHASTGTPVWVNNTRCALLGRVSMDMISIDLSRCPDTQIGDEVELWGEGLSIDEIARYAGTISYALMCGVTQRVQKIYTD